MAKKIYLSPERRPNPHAPYWGYPGVYEHDVCCEIAEYCKEALIRCGFEVKIARPEDSMEKRTKQAVFLPLISVFLSSIIENRIISKKL